MYLFTVSVSDAPLAARVPCGDVLAHPELGRTDVRRYDAYYHLPGLQGQPPRREVGVKARLGAAHLFSGLLLDNSLNSTFEFVVHITYAREVVLHSKIRLSFLLHF